MKIVLATRRSPLALKQAEMVAERLRRLGREPSLLEVVTAGDRQKEWSLEKKGGKGLFTAELEAAVLAGRADAAVHSAKDLPGEMAAGLAIAGYLPRADARDVLVRRERVEMLTVATGSPRRRLQLAAAHPGLRFAEIRGNVDTRLRKIAEGRADATVLAAAGLLRLGISQWPGLTFETLGLERMVPAVGQAAIAVQCRAEEAPRLAEAFDPATARALGLERALQRALEAGCQTAFAAHAVPGRLYFFHERTGRREIGLAPGDLDDPGPAAARLLADLGLAQ